MHGLRLLIIVIGIFLSGLAYAQGEGEVNEDGGSTKPGMVLVEPDNIVKTAVEGEYRLKPYRERRGRWGMTFSAAYSTYEPLDYEPDQVTEDFADVYSTPEMPMIEIALGVKRNLDFGSLGGEVAVGVYMNESDDPTLGHSTLQLIPIKLGATLYLDTLASEPLFVPYIAGGVYTISYKESLGGTSNNGNTQVAFYANAGVEMQLDWIDRENARVAYESSGIQSSFLFAEVRTMTEGGAEGDPNLASSMSFAGGLRVEF